MKSRAPVSKLHNLHSLQKRSCNPPSQYYADSRLHEQVQQQLKLDSAVCIIDTDCPLRYREVFIFTRDYDFYYTETDASGNVTRPVSGLLRGLREADVPVMVLDPGDGAALRDLATLVGPDRVLAASISGIHGLEKKMVVWVQEERERTNERTIFLLTRVKE